MSNQINSLVITLKKDTHEEDAGRLVSAIMEMKNVLSVDLHATDLMGDLVARNRIEDELREKILPILFPSYKGRNNE